ncbi:hypothetical protein AT6N2_C0234 [Agrobacterium tumefaciens]|nr:hypothetical protein AT6N2_C0234 [Agrobacterium tumefaciens]
MAFGIDDQMPVQCLRNGETDRGFFRHAAEIFEIEQLGEALKIRTRHQADVIDRRQGYFDDRTGSKLLQVIMRVAKIGPGHRASPSTSFWSARISPYD